MLITTSELVIWCCCILHLLNCTVFCLLRCAALTFLCPPPPFAPAPPPPLPPSGLCLCSTRTRRRHCTGFYSFHVVLAQLFASVCIPPLVAVWANAGVCACLTFDCPTLFIDKNQTHVNRIEYRTCSRVCLHAFKGHCAYMYIFRLHLFLWAHVYVPLIEFRFLWRHYQHDDEFKPTINNNVSFSLSCVYQCIYPCQNINHSVWALLIIK